jgi:hypothetical protein
LSFYLLLAYLVDHISIHLSFILCSVVSLFLVVSYLRLVVGMRFAAVEAGTAQFLYLMQMTDKIRWSERFERKVA